MTGGASGGAAGPVTRDSTGGQEPATGDGRGTTGTYPPGARVRVRAGDPRGHTRAPRYVRGHRGRVVEVQGRHRLPDDVMAGARALEPEPVYAVAFMAADLWDEGDHHVIVNLWHRYLEPADGE